MTRMGASSILLMTRVGRPQIGEPRHEIKVSMAHGCPADRVSLAEPRARAAARRGKPRVKFRARRAQNGAKEPVPAGHPIDDGHDSDARAPASDAAGGVRCLLSAGGAPGWRPPPGRRRGPRPARARRDRRSRVVLERGRPCLHRGPASRRASHAAHSRSLRTRERPRGRGRRYGGQPDRDLGPSGGRVPGSPSGAPTGAGRGRGAEHRRPRGRAVGGGRVDRGRRGQRSSVWYDPRSARVGAWVASASADARASHATRRLGGPRDDHAPARTSMCWGPSEPSRERS
jgi:hypothetical protein